MPVTSAKGFPTPTPTEDNANHTAIQNVAQRLDDILTAHTAAQITALATTDLWTGREQRQTDGTGTAKRQQTGLYLYDGATWQPGIGDGAGGTGPTPVLTAASVNPNMGTTGTSTWEWWMMGDWAMGQMIFTWGGTGVTPGTGELIVPLPVACAAFPAPSAARAVPLGSALLRGSAGASTYDMTLITQGGGASVARLAYHTAAGSVKATGTTPITVGAAGDTIKVDFCYLT
jgi:hypothetical protein